MIDCGKRMPMKHSYRIQNEIGLIIVILDKQRNCLTLMSVQRLAVDYLWNLM